jgi:hypothetical protein
MTKPFAKLASVDTYALRELPESGMGYYILTGRLDNEQHDRTLVIVGDRIIPATDHSSLFTMKDLGNREPFPQQGRGGVDLGNLRVTLSTVTLPLGYVAAVGAVPLLGALTLSTSTKFYRLIMAGSDHRYSAGTLAKDTYLTTELDHQLVNTGFGAVSRYALPIPVPASNLFEYEFPAGTVLSVGTVPSNFGQSGGGVEVKTTAAILAAQKTLPKLADC